LILAALTAAILAILLLLLAAMRLLLKALFTIITLASALFASFLLLTATAKANLLALLEPPLDDLLRLELDLLLELFLLEAISSPNIAKVKMIIV